LGDAGEAYCTRCAVKAVRAQPFAAQAVVYPAHRRRHLKSLQSARADSQSARSGSKKTFASTFFIRGLICGS
jgi:hypothetical protein